MYTQIPLNQLTISPRNVRTVNPSKAADKELIASLQSHGLLQNLVVTRAKRGKFEVEAGGRRLAGLEYLAKQKEIPDDYLTDCNLKTKDDALTEISLVENTHRVAMHPADELVAYSDLIDNQGLEATEVAERFGKPLTHVKKILSLGRVCPKLMDEYRKGKLTIEEMQAFTLSDDHERQLACYRELSKNYQLYPGAIKCWLMGEAVTTNSRIGAFVGKAAYVRAGGAVSTDLFGKKVYLSDPELVYTLAEKKLTKTAEKIVSDEGWSGFTVVCSSDFREAEEGKVQLSPEHIGVPDKLRHRLADLEAELKEIDTRGEDENWPDELLDASNEKEDEITQAEKAIDEYLTYTDDQKAISIIIVGFDYQGKLLVKRGMADRKAVQANNTNDENHESDTHDQGEKQPCISNALKTDLGMYRQQACKAVIANKASVAIDLLHYTICFKVLAEWGCSKCDLLDTSIRFVGSETTRKDTKESIAASELEEARAALDTQWLTPDTQAERFDAFRALPKRTKEKLLAYCVASSLTIETRGVSDLQDHLIDLLEVPFEKYWRPTKENYLSRVSLPILASTLEPVLGKEWADKAKSGKKGQVVEGLVEHFTNPPTTEAAKWVPSEF
ncbi:ParB/RepB/Spo0J family partition protein [Porticoccus sp. GXU_MW_L64]